MTWEFEVGKQVVCIRDDWVRKKQEPVRFPAVGEILTIREISTQQNSLLAPALLALRFIEIVNPVVESWRGPTETWYHAECFRPVKDTSIECFQKLLVTPPLKEKVYD